MPEHLVLHQLSHDSKLGKDLGAEMMPRGQRHWWVSTWNVVSSRKACTSGVRFIALLEGLGSRIGRWVNKSNAHSANSCTRNKTPHWETGPLVSNNIGATALRVSGPPRSCWILPLAATNDQKLNESLSYLPAADWTTPSNVDL